MDYVCTFADQDGYLMSILVRQGHCEDEAWTRSRDIAGKFGKTDNWTRFKIERGDMTSEGWVRGISETL